MKKTNLLNTLATIFKKEGEVEFNGVRIESINDDGDWEFIVGEGDDATPYCYSDADGKVAETLESITDMIWYDFFDYPN